MLHSMLHNASVGHNAAVLFRKVANNQLEA